MYGFLVEYIQQYKNQNCFNLLFFITAKFFLVLIFPIFIFHFHISRPFFCTEQKKLYKQKVKINK